MLKFLFFYVCGNDVLTLRRLQLCGGSKAVDFLYHLDGLDYELVVSRLMVILLNRHDSQLLSFSFSSKIGGGGPIHFFLKKKRGQK